MISYHMISYHMISYDIISYHMISYDMISYHIAAAASRYNGDRKIFSGTLLRKNDLQKIKNMSKRSARKFCTFSLLNHHKIFFLEPVSTTFHFQGKSIFCERARNSCEHPPFCCRGVNLERSNTVKTHTK